MKPRLHYFDMLKGIAIFMVVMGHVLTMCVREIDRATLFKFIGAVHMPLFFFISGWMTYRSDGRGAALGKRAAQLLVPMLFMSTLWIWYFPHSGLQSPLYSTFKGLWLETWK
ncbi:MAG: acyltransferase family protein, partial [Muribaculaceae bacterium]|nr:acyltransferase family protein [Muribaculaceae bacterium]